MFLFIIYIIIIFYFVLFLNIYFCSFFDFFIFYAFIYFLFIFLLVFTHTHTHTHTHLWFCVMKSTFPIWPGPIKVFARAWDLRGLAGPILVGTEGWRLFLEFVLLSCCMDDGYSLGFKYICVDVCVYMHVCIPIYIYIYICIYIYSK